MPRRNYRRCSPRKLHHAASLACSTQTSQFKASFRKCRRLTQKSVDHAANSYYNYLMTPLNVTPTHHIVPRSRDTVLLVVDMQNGFLGEKSAHIIRPVHDLVSQWCQAGGQVVFTRFFNRPASPHQRLIGWRRLQGPPETDLHTSFATFASTVIDKDIYTAFTAEFINLCAVNGWRTIVICGVATDGCVLKTAVDAFERGMVPLVVRDACASHAGNEIHQAGLTLIERFIGKNQVISSQQIDFTATELSN